MQVRFFKAIVLTKLLIFIMAVLCSCGKGSVPQNIKPDKIKKDAPARTGDEITITPDDANRNQPANLQGKLPPVSEPTHATIAENTYAQFSLSFITRAIIFYRDAYSKMPLKIEDMLDGWLLLWPNNHYTGKPVKILDHMPDINNRGDFGNLYYERVSDDTAYVYLITLDIRNSTRELTVWEVQKQEIFYEEMIARMRPDDPTLQMARELKNKPPEERLRYYTTGHAFAELDSFFTQAMMETGIFNSSFEDLLRKTGFTVPPKGLEFFKNAISKDLFQFDTGSCGDGELNYFDFSGMNEDIRKCWKLYPDLGTLGTVDKGVGCPDDSSKRKSVLNSKNVFALNVPDDLTISGNDIR
jgi:hypothetical protein